MGGCGEDGPLVIAQGLEPGADIGGMVGAIFKCESKIGAQERCAKFGDQLFLRVAGIAEALLIEGAIKTVRMARPVNALM